MDELKKKLESGVKNVQENLAENVQSVNKVISRSKSEIEEDLKIRMEATSKVVKEKSAEMLIAAMDNAEGVKVAAIEKAEELAQITVKTTKEKTEIISRAMSEKMEDTKKVISEKADVASKSVKEAAIVLKTNAEVAAKKMLEKLQSFDSNSIDHMSESILPKAKLKTFRDNVGYVSKNIVDAANEGVERALGGVRCFTKK